MGRFSTTVQVKNSFERTNFASLFCDMMKKRGLVKCSEDEAAQSYLLAFGEGWATLASGEYNENPQKSCDDARNIAAALNTSAFSVEVVDSDFALLKLCASNGGRDEVIVGDSSGYGIEKQPRGTQAFWQPLLAEGRTWEQFTETAAKNAAFAEDTLAELAEILGIEPRYICADFDDIAEKAGGNVMAVYFRKAAKAKSMSLNAAFKQVFGEALEPLGFKLIKSKYPYFVRVVSNEIIHYVTIANERADGRGYNGVIYKCFNVFCGVSTVYNSKIDFDTDPRKLFFWGLDSVHEIYTKSHWYDLDMKYRSSIMEFYYNPTSMADMLKALTRALKVTEDIALPVINPAVTLEKCMGYFGMMEHFIFPDLGDCGDGLFITRWFSADDYVMFCERRSEHEIEHCRHELNSNLNLSPKMKISLEERIKFIMDEREERQKKFYEIYDNPEMHEKAPAELERRKKANTEKLRGYGLNI